MFFKPRDDIYASYDTSSYDAPKQYTTQPVVTGTSVLAVKFDSGVVIAADNLGKQILPTLQAAWKLTNMF
jgi:20S proteasome subunit beta 7